MDKITKDNKKEIIVEKMGKECALSLNHFSDTYERQLAISLMIANYRVPQEIQLDVINSCSTHYHQILEKKNKLLDDNSSISEDMEARRLRENLMREIESWPNK